MPRARKSVPCRSCDVGKATRLGLCNACYLRRRRGSSGSECEVCACYDVRLLRAVKLSDGSTHTGCHNHAWLAERSRPRPSTLLEWVNLCAVPGDRRRPDVDRRRGKRRSAIVRNRRLADDFDLERKELRATERRA